MVGTRSNADQWCACASVSLPLGDQLCPRGQAARPESGSSCDLLISANGQVLHRVFHSHQCIFWLCGMSKRREREARVSYGRPLLACRRQPAEESQGPGVKPFTPDPSGPSRRDRPATVPTTAQRSRSGGARRVGTRSGFDAGRRLRTMRTSLARAQCLHAYGRASCRAPAAGRARGAKRERAHSPDEAAARPDPRGPA